MALSQSVQADPTLCIKPFKGPVFCPEALRPDLVNGNVGR